MIEKAAEAGLIKLMKRLLYRWACIDMPENIIPIKVFPITYQVHHPRSKRENRQ